LNASNEIPGFIRHTLALLMLCGAIQPALAQVQRSFVNPSFEAPALTASTVSAGCYVQVDQNTVPGWNTTHASMNGSGNCTSPSRAIPGRLIEMWRDGFSGVKARDGFNFAELNAEQASRIYQNVCLVQGERVTWSFSHRGRNGVDTYDRAQMKVGATGSIVQVGTTSNGSYETIQVFPGFDATAAVSAAEVNGWRDYSGQFTYMESSGTSNIGFEAVSGTTSGNFLDNIQIQLAPFVDFSNASSADTEGDSGSNQLPNRPTLRINGTVSAAFNVTVRITGGTAQRGRDYFTNTPTGTSDTLTVTVPAGVYDGASAASLIALPVYVAGNTILDGNKTISFSIDPPQGVSPAFLLSSSTSCGAPVQTTWDYTILDDDGPLVVTKQASPPVSVNGSLTQYDIQYQITVTNPNAVGNARTYVLTDRPAFEADTRIDGLRSLACTSSSGTGCGPGVLSAPQNNAGPWTLHSGRALSARQTDSYTLTVRFTILPGQSGPDACGSAGGGLINSAAVRLAGEAADSASITACQPTPTPVWVTLRKNLPSGRINGSDQFQVRMVSGGIEVTNGSATTTGSSVQAATGRLVLPAGSTLQFTEALKTDGSGADQAPTGYNASLACTGASNAPGGSGTALATQQQWAAFTPVAGENLDCTVTNTPRTYNVTADADPGGRAQCTPSPVFHGKSSACTAMADAGYSFAGWDGDCQGLASACTLANITSDKHSHARFTPNPGTLTITKILTGGPSPRGEMSFRVDVVCTSASHVSSVTVPANAGSAQVVVTGIPAGDRCEVKEGDLPQPDASYQWADPEYVQPTDAMAPGGSLSATVTNRLIRKLVPTTITKTLQGLPVAGAGGDYGFSLNCGADGVRNGVITLTSAAASGKTTIDLPHGATCDILLETSKAKAPDGYEWLQETSTAPGRIEGTPQGEIINRLRPLPKVSAIKTAVPAALVVGASNQRYEIAVKVENGPTTAPVTLADTLPDGIVLSGAPTLGTDPSPAPAVLQGCSSSGSDLGASCQITAGLPVGTYVVAIPVDTRNATPGTTSGNNTAHLTGGGDPACKADEPQCNPSTPDVPVNTPAAITTVKMLSSVNGAAPGANVKAGDVLAYTITSTNAGGTEGTTMLTEHVPDQTTYSGPDGHAWTCQGLAVVAGTQCQALQGVPAGGSASISFTVTVVTPATGSRVANSVTSSADPACVACSTSTPIAVPRIKLTKSVTTAPMLVGVANSYVLKVENVGGAVNSQAIVVSDTLPASLAIGTLPGGCAREPEGSQTVRCTIAASALAAGASSSFTLPVTPVSAGQVTNTATATGGGDPACTGAGDCVSSVTDTPVNVPGQLEVTKSNGVDRLTRDTTTTYMVTIRNVGGTAVSGVSWTDAAMSGLANIRIATGVATQGSTTGSCSGLTCSGITVTAGGSVSYTVTAKVTGAGGSSAVNTATVSGEGCAAGCSSTDTDPIVTGTGAVPVPVPAMSQAALAVLSLFLLLASALVVRRSRG
jgi:hypothetical protein